MEKQTKPEVLEEGDVDKLINDVRDAAEAWAARPARERAEILYKTAEILRVATRTPDLSGGRGGG
ncbi:aldehyde dehydrogenase family protein [Corynebacterium glutamicum]|uniref:aldehyde dehydrogenase family protein n=1 Tax=Corynebacterium glutamicum TaxID=1718 RepID=UPI001466BEB4|nr:aldehyde dehydrogenase family protein [Corynebacterium glutamicum]GFK20506.1 hypothetical protein KbCgl_30780 [Corynebacterium glutamicum]